MHDIERCDICGRDFNAKSEQMLYVGHMLWHLYDALKPQAKAENMWHGLLEDSLKEAGLASLYRDKYG